MFDKKTIMDKVYNIVTNPEIEDSGKVFNETQVAEIMSVVSIMVGDPRPAENEEFYRKLMDHLNLPEGLHIHMLQMIMSARQALKAALMENMSHVQSKDLDDKLKELIDMLPLDKD